MRALLIAATLLLLAPATAAAADVVIDGRGWGHGVGMSQYGAYGYALREGRDHQFILGHYYTGSALGTAPATRMRVRLKAARAPKISGATRAVSGGRRITLRDDRGYRFQALDADRVAVIDGTTGRTRARLRVPVTVTGGASTRLHGAAENGLSNGFYRGRMVLSREGGRVLAVNHVSLEHYLYGVVPAEMPASWPAEALAAQAVVARSYALTSRSTGLPWDVFADVRSQVYRGVLAEIAASTAAVQATRGEVVTVGGQVAQTFFFPPRAGARPPTRRASAARRSRTCGRSRIRTTICRRCTPGPPASRAGRPAQARLARDRPTAGVGVASRSPSGRAATVLVRGSGGDRTVSAASVRTALGLRSTWIERITGP